MTDQFSVKYRPRSLNSMVVGNPEVLDLAESMAKKAQAILITGHSGCGKTTLGFILSGLINGERHKDALIEKNCADESGKDAVREIHERIMFKPSGLKHVVLLDEVQGLSHQAMASLLKLIESPPHERVVFILCTNEPYKLKETLVNRCRKLHIEKPEVRDFAKYLYRVALKERVKKTKELQSICIQIAKVCNCVPRESLQKLQDVVDMLHKGKKFDIIQTFVAKTEEADIDYAVGVTLIAIYTALKDPSSANEAAQHIITRLPADAMGYLTRLQAANYFGIQMI